MKKGFTMIELIFVIVILGVLAAVAIPKLNATRDDAEQAKAMTNLATLMGDLTSFYTSQGEFKADISAMTNVPLTEQDGENKGKFDYMIKNEKCLTFETAGAALVITPNKTASQKVCQNVLTSTSTQNIIRGTYTCETEIQVGATISTITVDSKANDTKAGAQSSIAKACGNKAAGKFGKPDPLTINTTYHNVISTQLGKTLDDATGNLTQQTDIKKFEPVIMSFEGAGVAF